MQKLIPGVFQKTLASQERVSIFQVPVSTSITVRCLARLFPQGDYVHPNPLVQPEGTGRKFKSKFANPKYKKERANKVIKVDLPDFHQKNEKDMSPEELRTEMKKLGIQPFRPWKERPMYVSATSAVMEPYIPPEGDGKASALSTERAKQTLEFLGKKSKSMMAVRKIRQYEEDFDYKEFSEQALQIYIKLHEALVKMDEKELHRLATERAYPIVVNDAKLKTLRWAFHGSLEAPRVVHARQMTVLNKENYFAQITVRFHTQQTLAVYDRFGRLIHGSESVLKDVLEYVVFEKHITNVYGLWRVHDKIIPPWTVMRPVSHYTFRLPTIEETVAPSQQQAE